jgi:hypothetical protein
LLILNPYYTPKTDRKRGAIYALILYAARHLGRFTTRQLTPTLTLEQAGRNCLALARKGRLQIIQPGTPGQKGKPAIYAAL